MPLLLKLTTLLAFAGGPGYVSDRLQGLLDPRLATALAFAPVGLLLLGALTLHDADSGFSRGVTRAGLVASLLLCLQNAWLVRALLIARDSTTPALHIPGLSAGTLAAALYVRLARRRLREGYLAPGWSWRPPARLGDWLALVVCTGFALAGVLLRARDSDAGITVFVFFGGMALFMALHLYGWRRFERRARAPSVSTALIDGTVLQPSRRRALLGFAALCAYGSLLRYFDHAAPLVFRCITLGLALLGATGFTLALLRVIPPGRLRLEADSLFVRKWRYTLEVPWHAIAAVYLGELHGNRLICLDLRAFALVRTHPPEAGARAQKTLANALAFTGAPLAIASSLYELDAHVLLEELRRRAEAAASDHQVTRT